MGLQIMRLDFVQRQRAWEAERAREAPALPSDPVEEDEDGEELGELPSSGNAMQTAAESTLPSQRMPDDEVDEVLQREQEEMDALLALIPDTPQDEEEEEERAVGTHSQNLWSDDDDYDALFSEVMDQGFASSGHQSQGVTAGHMSCTEEDEEMDLS